jgi:hypothetical protein
MGITVFQDDRYGDCRALCDRDFDPFVEYLGLRVVV